MICALMFCLCTKKNSTGFTIDHIDKCAVYASGIPSSKAFVAFKGKLMPLIVEAGIVAVFMGENTEIA